MRAAGVVAAALASNSAVDSDYAGSVIAEFDDYRSNRNYFYKLETRWAGSSFWRRRKERTELQKGGRRLLSDARLAECAR